jgi:sulfur carrier protein
MRILVNGSWHELVAPDIGGALQELGYGEAVVATALNGEFVPILARSDARLCDGDRLEVLAPLQGG